MQIGEITKNAESLEAEVKETVMRNRVNIMIVWRQRLFRECLASILDEVEHITVLDQVDNLDMAMAQVWTCPPDVLLVELEQHEENQLRWIQEIIEAGVSGYLLKESSLRDLMSTVDRVSRGQVAYSPEENRPLLERLAELSRERKIRENLSDSALTPRQIEILEMIADSRSNQQIADDLHLSLYTVKNHVHNILQKLEVRHRFEAVERAFTSRWLFDRRRSSGQRYAAAM